MALRRSVSHAIGACRGLRLWPEMQASTGCFMTQSWATDAGPPNRADQRPHLHPLQEVSHPHRLFRSLAGYPVSWERDQLTAGHHLHSNPRRRCSTESSSPSIADDEWNLEYSGAVSNTIRTLKMVSIGTATLSLIGSPLYIMATMDGQYTAVKVMAASGFTLFGLFTTGLLHWFVGPYVHKLWFHEPSQQVKVQILSVFAQPRWMVFSISDVEHPEGISPLQTFQAKGRTLFIDEATFENKELLEKLTPPSPFDMDPDGSPDKKEGEQ